MNLKYEFIKEKVNKHKKALQYIFFVEEIEDIIEITEIEEKYIIDFGRDNKVIYTLKSITAEVCFKKYLIWINNNIIMSNKMYCKRSLEYNDGNFIEYVYQNKLDYHNEEYYYSLGQLIAIANTIGCNLMISKDIAEKNGIPIILDVSQKLESKIVKYNIPLFEAQHFGILSNTQMDYIYSGYCTVTEFVRENVEVIKMAINIFFREYNIEIRQ